MSGIVVISIGGHHEDLRALRLANSHVGVIVCSSHSQLPPPTPIDVAKLMRISEQEYTCADSANWIPQSAREERRQKQPFYRQLKKYRKP